MKTNNKTYTIQPKHPYVECILLSAFLDILMNRHKLKLLKGPVGYSV